MRRALLTLLVVAALGGCATDTPDPAQLAAPATLDQALDRAARAYDVPRDLLAAISYAETRFGPPVANDAHEHASHDTANGEPADDAHAPPEVGPLHLRHGAGLDTLARAQALLPVAPERLADNVGLGVAGAAAVLAELGRATDADPDDLESWAEAVARYSGLSDRPSQVAYAAQVFDVLRAGAREQAFTGETVAVPAHARLRAVEDVLPVGQVAQFSADYGPARWVAASSSNYTSGRGGAPIQYVVIHTMQGSYAGSISWFQNSRAGASAHYNIRSSDGEVTQMVANTNTAWHAGNWHYNQRSIGIEHEGYVADPGRWYTEAMYRSSARLVRALCDRYRIPIDRNHIIGHYQIPVSGSGAPCSTTSTSCGGAGRHYDPGRGGTAWNWNHFMDLVRGGGTVTPPPPPPPATPAYAATLVGVSCPATARSGERPVAYVEYRNTGTATWDTRNTRLGTSNPRDHNGVFFDMENWVARNRPTAVDRATAPGATGRFSFVIGIPDVTSERAVTENYALVQESVTWFGPADTAVSCSVRVSPRTPPPPPVDSGTPPPADTGVVEPADTGVVEPEDTGVVEPADTGVVEPTDTGTPEPEDAGTTTDTGTITEDTGADPTAEAPSDEAPGCGCRAAPSSRPEGVLALAGLAAVFAARRRRARS